jgi:hypothetical protein
MAFLSLSQSRFTRRFPCSPPIENGEYPNSLGLRKDREVFTAMTAALDQTSQVMRQLIHCCREAQVGFRLAADATENQGLKRLLDIYAQQRTRFAEELREYIPDQPEISFEVRSSGAASAGTRSDADLLQHCLQQDEKTLALYQRALQQTGIPTKAHFLISAQLSLMQRVRDRMSTMLNGTSSSPAGGLNRERAVL